MTINLTKKPGSFQQNVVPLPGESGQRTTGREVLGLGDVGRLFPPKKLLESGLAASIGGVCGSSMFILARRKSGNYEMLGETVQQPLKNTTIIIRIPESLQKERVVVLDLGVLAPGTAISRDTKDGKLMFEISEYAATPLDPSSLTKFFLSSQGTWDVLYWGGKKSEPALTNPISQVVCLPVPSESGCPSIGLNAPLDTRTTTLAVVHGRELKEAVQKADGVFSPDNTRAMVTRGIPTGILGGILGFVESAVVVDFPDAMAEYAVKASGDLRRLSSEIRGMFGPVEHILPAFLPGKKQG